MSTGNPFRKVHTNFYRCRPLGLAWALYQTFCWVPVIILCLKSQKKTQFSGEKIGIFKIFENMSIGKPFRKMHANFYRSRPLGLAWALYQTFCWVA